MKFSFITFLFAGSVLGASVPAAAAPAAPAAASAAAESVRSAEIAPGIAVAGQLREADLAGLKAQGYTAIIALRPDGEGPDQPSSGTMAAAAAAQGLGFTYIPVRPGAISDEAVERLGAALAASPGKLMIYCRSGSRAARTWGLAEASRPGGRDASAILAAIRAAGQSGEDLQDALAQRIASRPAPSR